MIKRMPDRIKNRDVQLITIGDELDMDNIARSLWETVQKHKVPGTWFRIAATMDMPAEALKKAYSAIYMKTYTRGIEQFLKVRVSEKDGVCFSWTMALSEERMKELAADKKRARLDKKLKLNKDRKERIEKEQLSA